MVELNMFFCEYKKYKNYKTRFYNKVPDSLGYQKLINKLMFCIEIIFF